MARLRIVAKLCDPAFSASTFCAWSAVSLRRGLIQSALQQPAKWHGGFAGPARAAAAARGRSCLPGRIVHPSAIRPEDVASPGRTGCPAPKDRPGCPQDTTAAWDSALLCNGLAQILNKMEPASNLRSPWFAGRRGLW